MNFAARIRWSLLSLALVLAVPAMAQQQSGKTAKKAPKPEKPDSLKDTTLAKFYESEDPMEVTLTFNIKRVKGDKGDDAPWRFHARDHARRLPAQLRHSGIDRCFHLVPERLSVLNEVPRRSCGGTIG